MSLLILNHCCRSDDMSMASGKGDSLTRIIYINVPWLEQTQPWIHPWSLSLGSNKYKRMIGLKFHKSLWSLRYFGDLLVYLMLNNWKPLTTSLDPYAYYVHSRCTTYWIPFMPNEILCRLAYKMCYFMAYNTSGMCLNFPFRSFVEDEDDV